MEQRRFQLLCACLLGIGQLCMQTAFDAESFILESVIHSIHERDPGRIGLHAGYYGQSVIYAACLITCLFTPSILNICNPKVILVTASIFYAAFPVGFLFINSYYYFFSTALLGIGRAFFRLGQTTYLTSHSTRERIESNVSLSGAIGSCSFLMSSVILAAIMFFTAGNNNSGSVKFERNFSDLEIRLLSTILIGVSIIAIVTMCLIPLKDVENCIESSKKKNGFLEDFKLTLSTVFSTKILQLLPMTILCGFNASFFLSIFPTAINFNNHNSNLLYAPAIYSLGSGIGEVMMGGIATILSKRIEGFGLKPTMVIGSVAVTVYCILVHISTPFDAPMRPTNQNSLLINQSYFLILLIAIICGISDCCLNNVRSVICVLVLPEKRAQSVSVSRIYHAASCVVCFFFSPITPLYVYTIGLPILAVISTFFFVRVVNGLSEKERNTTNCLRSSICSESQIA